MDKKNNLYKAFERTKQHFEQRLSQLPSGGGGNQIQSDWDQSNSEAPDYIKNRPFYRERYEELEPIRFGYEEWEDENGDWWEEEITEITINNGGERTALKEGFYDIHPYPEDEENNDENFVRIIIDGVHYDKKEKDFELDYYDNAEEYTNWTVHCGNYTLRKVYEEQEIIDVYEGLYGSIYDGSQRQLITSYNPDYAMYPYPNENNVLVNIDGVRYFPNGENFIEGTEEDTFKYKLICGNYTITYEYELGAYDDCMGYMEGVVKVYWEGVAGDNWEHDVSIYHDFYIDIETRPTLYWEAVEGDTSSHTLSIGEFYYYWHYNKIETEYIRFPHSIPRVDTGSGGFTRTGDILRLGYTDYSGEDSHYVLYPGEWMNADFEENDETTESYIKNKPFGTKLNPNQKEIISTTLGLYPISDDENYDFCSYEDWVSEDSATSEEDWLSSNLNENDFYILTFPNDDVSYDDYGSAQNKQYIGALEKFETEDDDYYLFKAVNPESGAPVAEIRFDVGSSWIEVVAKINSSEVDMSTDEYEESATLAYSFTRLISINVVPNTKIITTRMAFDELSGYGGYTQLENTLPITPPDDYEDSASNAVFNWSLPEYGPISRNKLFKVVVDGQEIETSSFHYSVWGAGGEDRVAVLRLKSDELEAVVFNLNSCKDAALYSYIQDKEYEFSVHVFAINQEEVKTIQAKYIPEQTSFIDYEQYDPSKKGFIKNKPFGTELVYNWEEIDANTKFDLDFKFIPYSTKISYDNIEYLLSEQDVLNDGTRALFGEYFVDLINDSDYVSEMRPISGSLNTVRDASVEQVVYVLEDPCSGLPFGHQLQNIISISVGGQKFTPQIETTSTEYDDCTGDYSKVLYTITCGNFVLKASMEYEWSSLNSCIITWQPIDGDSNSYEIEVEYLYPHYMYKPYKRLSSVRYQASGASTFTYCKVFKSDKTELVEKKMEPKYLPEVAVQYENESKTSILLNSSTEGSSKQFRLTIDDSGSLTIVEVI